MLAMLMTLFVSGLATAPTTVGSERRAVVWIIDTEGVIPAGGVGLMRHEVSRIWLRYGIELRWSRRLPDESPAPMLVVLVNSTTDEHAPLGHVSKVGDTFRRQIVVSDSALSKMLNASGIYKVNPAWTTLYSRMFARVLSHELGHLLLNSAAHSAVGLMRARFGVVDVKSSADEGFSLTATEATIIRATVTAHTLTSNR